MELVAGAHCDVRRVEFFNDFSKPELTRCYEITLDIGAIVRRKQK